MTDTADTPASTEAATDAVDYDPVGADTLDDPFPAYAELRARCPVHHHDGLDNPMLTFSRREDVQWVLTDQATWSNRYGPGISFSDDNVGDLQRYDPPVHETRRRFLRAPFLPRTVDASRPGIAALANELVDSFAGREVIELHDDYALPLPVRAFTALMGIDDEAADDFKTWADALTIGMTYPDQARDARRAMSAYTRAQIEQRRAAAADVAPGEDPVGTVVPEGLLSHLACHALDDGTIMPVDEVAAMVGQLLVAGHETTTSLIANAVWRLLEVPERWERLVAEPELVPNVIEESLRHDPPVLGLCKTNNVAVERHGVDHRPRHQGHGALCLRQPRRGDVRPARRVRDGPASHRGQAASVLRVGRPLLPGLASGPPHRAGRTRGPRRTAAPPGARRRNPNASVRRSCGDAPAFPSAPNPLSSPRPVRPAPRARRAATSAGPTAAPAPRGSRRGPMAPTVTIVATRRVVAGQAHADQAASGNAADQQRTIPPRSIDRRFVEAAAAR